MPSNAKGEQTPPDEGGPNKVWVLLFVAVIAFTVGMMLVSFPAGIYTVFGGNLSTNYTASTPVSAISLDLFFVTVPIPLAGTFGSLFIGSSVVYFAFLLLAAAQGAGLLGALRGSLAEGPGALFTNPLTAVVVMLGATSLVTIIVDTVQTNAGVSTGSLSGDPLSLLINFTLAPILEETTFRVVMLGVPVVLLAMIMFREASPSRAARALWRPSSIWDSNEGAPGAGNFRETGASIFPDGGDSFRARAIRPAVYAFLLLSSFSFGYAHYASGAGWGPGKISEAALAGLALGYLYIKYGFHTDVLLHWSVNYVGSVFSFLAQVLYGIPWTSNSTNPLDLVPTLDIVFLLGVPSTLLVASEILKRLPGSRNGRSP